MEFEHADGVYSQLEMLLTQPGFAALLAFLARSIGMPCPPKVPGTFGCTVAALLPVKVEVTGFALFAWGYSWIGA